MARRVLAAFVAACLVGQPPLEAAQMLGAPASHSPRVQAPAPVSVPEFGLELAADSVIVDETYLAGVEGRGQVVYLLQDAHTNVEAQFNAVRVIDAVAEQRPVKTIFLEGGTGDSSLNFLKPLSDPSRRLAAAERFVRKGLLQAAEYVNLVSNNDLELWGVEDPELYARALEAYRAVAVSREAALTHLDQIDVTIGFIKEKTFSPLLNELDSARRAAAREELSPTDYLTLLNRVALAAGIDPLEAPLMERVGRLIREERTAGSADAGSGSKPDQSSADDLDIPAVLKAMRDMEDRLYAEMTRAHVFG